MTRVMTVFGSKPEEVASMIAYNLEQFPDINNES